MSKVFRDPIWGDIKLTEDEVRIVDTPQFQRLRGVRQLGLAHMVYPGAVHSRFLHSIGTLGAAEQILRAMEGEEVAFEDDPRSAIRIVALLHDLGHTPFAHLLEDEAGLYDRHDTRGRLKPMLDTLGAPVPAPAVEVLLDAVKPENMFMKDIVSNTICADLIDYIQRDGHFSGATGLRFRFDERLLGYFRLVPDREGATRLAIEPVKDKIRLDVITDLLQLLRYRYVLTERLTYHHAKLAASAMLVKAVTAAGRPDLNEFAALSDDQFLDFLSRREGKGAEVARDLVWRLQNRQLHKPVFRLTRGAVSKQMPVEEFANKYGSPAGRDDLERAILDEAAKLVRPKTLREGDIVLYTSPDYRMTMKEVDVLVHWKGEAAIPLRKVLAEEYWESVTLEEVKALEDRYGALWTSGVFINPALRNLTYEIEKACKRVLSMENDPLLGHALAQESSYADIVVAQRFVDDAGLARTAVEISQRTDEKLPREERIRRGVEEAVRLKATPEPKPEKGKRNPKGLDDAVSEP